MHYRSTNNSVLFEFNPFFSYESEGADWRFSLFMGMYEAWTERGRLHQQLFWSIEF